ncbi:hypothetical protein BV25DRAFT_1830884 [Artomyces pyxidatus]|uniref:Uncharacterized protein n=1 Tax=Artomyces pyxidatus TaxID=48021 RepID=A0ACB8SM97_9AGAM|nr:hypothetical protein BV25DRAFT_1830884 [Artomyces pyxidatus]
MARPTRRVADAGLGTLRKLPVEIIDCIFHELSDDLVSVICFCLAHKFLLAVGQTTIDACHRERTFAGTRIICIGSGDATDDLPEDLLTDEEFKEVTSVILDPDNNEPVKNGLYALSSCTQRYRKLERQEDVPNSFLYRLPEHERISLEALMKPNYSSPHPWALFNLSKHEYVRADAVAELGGYSASDPLRDCHAEVGLGSVLLGRVCWSSDSSISMPYDGNLHRGVWAGDRFKISPLIFKPGEEEQWKDVSEEVVAELIAIWKAEYDDEWEDRIQGRHHWHECGFYCCHYC